MLLLLLGSGLWGSSGTSSHQNKAHVVASLRQYVGYNNPFNQTHRYQACSRITLAPADG